MMGPSTSSIQDPQICAVDSLSLQRSFDNSFAQRGQRIETSVGDEDLAQKMPQGDFVVVEFVEENTVEVVHKSWIQTTRDAVLCYWPPKAGASSKAKRGEIPDKEKWKVYEVRILSFGDTFEKALQRARRAEETSNLDTDVEEFRRPSKKPAKFIDSETENADDEEDESQPSNSELVTVMAELPSPPQLTQPNGSSFGGRSSSTPLSCRAGNTILPSKTVSVARSSYSRSGSTSEASFSAKQLFNASTPSTSRAGYGIWSSSVSRKQDSDSTGFQSKVLLRLQNIEEAQAQIFQMLRSLTSASKAAEEEDLEEILSGPADTVEELEQLCNRLTDHSFKKQMTCYLTSLGGRNIGDTIRRMLRKVGTNALWSNYSMKGKKGKRSFIELSVARLITRACMKNHAKAKASEIEEEIGDCLKYAPKHKGGPKYKEPASKRSCEIHQTIESDSE